MEQKGSTIFISASTKNSHLKCVGLNQSWADTHCRRLDPTWEPCYHLVTRGEGAVSWDPWGDPIATFLSPPYAGAGRESVPRNDSHPVVTRHVLVITFQFSRSNKRIFQEALFSSVHVSQSDIYQISSGNVAVCYGKWPI